MGENGLITFGDALKAFRRNVYMFPDQWKTLVVCASGTQAKYAMGEAQSILNASSLPVQSFMHTTMRITTDRGGELQFVVVNGVPDTYRLASTRWPHIIIVNPNLPDEVSPYLRELMAHPDIEDRYFRMDDATL
jgi:hypothetical protein